MHQENTNEKALKIPRKRPGNFCTKQWGQRGNQAV